MKSKMEFHRQHEWVRFLLLAICCLLMIGSVTLHIKMNRLIATEKHSDNSVITNGPIHLAFVCGGHNSTRGFYTLIKSIIYHRTDSEIVLHIFVDNISGNILKKLFLNWKVPKLDVQFYDSHKLMKSVSWIPNEHYSGVFGLIKLVAPMKLANRGVNRLIFLDTDMLVLGDIASLHLQFLNKALWHEEIISIFGQINDVPFIGLVENQSDWYDEVHAAGIANLPWRAPGRGFNTGVMLIDLERLKTSKWEDEFRQVAFDELSGGKLKVQLADQDIMNTVLKLNRNFVVKLDCKFNIQINDNTNLSETCPSHSSEMGASSFRLVHWNSPKKLQTRNMFNDYYRKWYEMFENLSGDLLGAPARAPREDDERQHSPQPRKKLPASCDGLRPASHEKLRTFIDFLDYQIDERDEHGVTLAVHLSFDRMNALDQLAANWLGPISAAIYLRESDISSFHESINDSSALLLRRNIGYHLMFKDHGQSYPINKLRNLALEQTKTPYVYLSDVDFVPALDLYKYLKESIRVMMNPTNKNSTALVVPVFETREYKFDYPQDKAELLRQLDTGTISTFRATIWPQGQAATQYDKWKQASKPYEVQLEHDYEPFVVVHTASVPRYDERFVGFGWNKVEHVMLLAARDYKFHVLPEAYAVHQFHPASYDLSAYRSSRKYQSCAGDLKALFMSELLAENPKFSAGILASLLVPNP